MRLNTIKPADGARSARHRVGRGIGSGWGKTAGRGHKGQKSRAGGFHKVGFEGGQMPLYRRLPKRGFTSLTHRYVEEVRLSELDRLGADEIDLMVLKQAGVISILALDARVIKSGEIKRKVTVRGIGVTQGAKAAIAAAGGTVIESVTKQVESKKAEARKKAAAKKLALAKFEPKKSEPKKSESKKAEPKQAEPKKAETKKAESKKAETKKSDTKKSESKASRPK